LAIDCTREVFEEARDLGCGAIVAYHPPIFEAQKHFRAGCMAYDAARANIAIYSPHTALDAAEGGTNDVLGDALGMTERAPLGAGAGSPGYGRVGTVPGLSVDRHVERLKAALGLSHVLVSASGARRVTRVAVCAGSGGELVPEAIRTGAELFVTGELRHHEILRAGAGGMGVVCLLHSASERPALAALERALRARLQGVVVTVSERDREPLRVA
jgi:dinuclear metal center YbgI/SA1388 family protein